MSIWQHQIFILPKEEVDSFFSDVENLTIQDFDNINWWQYRIIELREIEAIFSRLLPEMRSWSENLIVFGDENSNCFKVFLENKKPIELSARIDLREVNYEFIDLLISFAKNENLVFLSDLSEDNLRIIYPNKVFLEQEIKENNLYEAFIKFLNNPLSEE